MNFSIRDEELLYRLRIGDEAAFDCLLKKFHLLFLKYAHRTVGQHSLDGISMEDVYIELCEHVYSLCFKFDETKGAQLGRFIQTCVLTYCRNVVRRCTGKSYTMLSSANSLDMAVTEDGSLYLMDIIQQRKREFDPLVYARSLERIHELDRYLQTLTELEKTILFAKIEGYSYREIANNYDCKEKKVDNTIQKIRRAGILKGFVD